MTNIPLHPEYEYLQAYCHYPLSLARQECEDSHKEMYKITTINWEFATDKETGEVDYNHVHKNIYEMTLGEFQEWCLGVCNEEVAEEIIKIEKISE